MTKTNFPIPLIELDPWLAPHEHDLQTRLGRYQDARQTIEGDGGLLGAASNGYRVFGFNRGERDGEPGVWYREWLPGALWATLTGAFNEWNRHADPLERGEWGVWYCFFPDSEYAHRLTHGSLLKLHVHTADGPQDRIPAYARRVVQEPGSSSYSAQFWMPPDPYVFRHAPPDTRANLRIYETHVGMAQEDARIGTFDEFRERILPRISRLGYDAVQLMAVQEHPYYGSFGYHVSNFYAVSSRFGTPEQLKHLIDDAHGLGLRVLLDLVHSHAVKNTNEGLNRLDGTDFQYFHAGARGEHPQWDSLLFDYAKPEVQRFLLSNVRYWLEEFRFDGVRMDGVGSMVYRDHGVGRVFSGYPDYFGPNVDDEAVTYLQLANDVAHAVNPQAITIAEDVSGMPGMARPASEGGLGFDYRLAMGVPDFWVQLLKERTDEQWNLSEIYQRMLDRRWGEKHVGYVESHDQALVGDKTLAFQLMGAAMYWSMGNQCQDVVVERGVALHKLIRLITFSLAGEAYLNFMGNEFGHPEWIDFPREGNGGSYYYARRQWSLADNPFLRYQGLERFDQAMLSLDSRFSVLSAGLIEQLAVHEDTKQLIYRRGPLVFAFNFHPTDSYFGLRIPVPDAADYRVVLHSDALPFAGMGRGIQDVTEYPWQPMPMYGRDQTVQIYLPSRSAQVLIPKYLAEEA